MVSWSSAGWQAAGATGTARSFYEKEVLGIFFACFLWLDGIPYCMDADFGRRGCRSPLQLDDATGVHHLAQEEGHEEVLEFHVD